MEKIRKEKQEKRAERERNYLGREVSRNAFVCNCLKHRKRSRERTRTQHTHTHTRKTGKKGQEKHNLREPGRELVLGSGRTGGRREKKELAEPPSRFPCPLIPWDSWIWGLWERGSPCSRGFVGFWGSQLREGGLGIGSRHLDLTGKALG